MKEDRRQKSEHRRRIIPMIIFALCALLFALRSNTSAELTAVANHDHIKIDFFYHGSTVSVKGTSDPGVDLVIKITSPDGHEVLKQKGKMAGILWMNTGTLNFENTPDLYSVHSTKKLEDLLSRDEMDKYVIGYPALEKHIELTPVSKGEEKDKWFNEFVRFKESSKLYAASSGKISTTMSNGRQNYYIMTEWPYQAPPGNYLVTVYAVKDKMVVEKAEAKVLVEQVGVIKTLSSMAKNSGALYGFLSIVIALGAGFGVGLIFRKGGGSH
ncbi:MAG: TIGR02186 family protein [Nitrospirae bacterium]|nr:TIGR02186 family protein [Nitrospirota bacterium]